MAKGSRIAKLMREALEAMAALASSQNHPSTINVALNRDGTVDAELQIHRWGIGEAARRSFQAFVTSDLDLPTLPKTVRVATAFAVDPDMTKEGTKKPKAYLNLYQGMPIMVLRNRKLENYQYLLTSSQNALDSVNDNGWRLKYIAFRLRYDQKFGKKRKGDE